jgi:pimeloyl-ACP methyl ester carboxylesterase
LKNKKRNSTDYLVFIIPGNPGIADYYSDFSNILTSKLNTLGKEAQIHIFSYLGFQKFPQEKIYSIQEEMEAWERKIAEILKKPKSRPGSRPKLVLIGHSIGAWIAQEIMRRNPKWDIQTAFFIYPFLRLNPEVKGQRKIGRLLESRLATILVGWVLRLFYFFPRKISRFLISILTKQQGKGARFVTLEYFSMDHIPRSVIGLAKTEFATLGDQLDWEFLRENRKKIVLFYTKSDIWAPEQDYRELQSSNLQIRLEWIEDSHHDFCTQDRGNLLVAERIISFFTRP